MVDRTDGAAPPVLVTGATGRIGRGVVDALRARGVRVRALSRTPEAATLPPDVEVVAGDFTAPHSLDAALDGVESVFLLWTAPPGTVPGVIERLASRPRQVVFLSSPHQTAHPFFQQPNPAAALHAEIESRLLSAGLVTTVVRPGMFASNAAFWWGPAIRAGDPVRWPYPEAQTAPVDERDVAAVAAHLLAAPLAGGDFVLTGPESLSQADQVRVIGEVLGRPLHLQGLSAAEFRAETAGTWPPAVVDMLLDAWAATGDRPAYVTTAVADLLGRPARTFRESMADLADAFGGPVAE